MKAIILSGLLLSAFAATAADFAPTHLTVHLASVHSQPGYNNINLGAGLRWADSAGDGPVAGIYYNSDRSTSAYAGYSWNWPLAGPVSVQLMAGGVTGYRRAAVAPMLLPSLAYAVTPRAAVRVSFAPAIALTTAVAHLSLDFRF